MSLASRSRLIAATLMIGAIAAPSAQAGLFSDGPDPKAQANRRRRASYGSTATPTTRSRPPRAPPATALTTATPPWARDSPVVSRS